MDKSILKKFAIESRQDLMKKIEGKLKTFYIDEEFSKEQKNDIYVLTNDKHSLNLTNEQFQKRELLIKRIKELSLEQVIEEASYTWFNRIIALRYMELNDMLPLTKTNSSLGIRVLSSKDNTPDPEIMKFTNLANPELDIDFKKEYYAKLEEQDRYEYVLLLVCKKLGKVIPQVFDGVTDYIDILIPDNLLKETGFINKIVTEVPENNFVEVEVIGWLYQFYISEKKDEVFADLKKNIKISKENVPSATQLFTPDWVVKYLVNNSLGKIVSDGQISDISSELELYITNDLKVEKKELEDIKFLDPCCGSGHILVYAFDVFVKAYEKLGFNKDKIIKNIVNKNIYGMDIDDRACQLSNLSIMLKACKYDKKAFSYDLFPNIISIQESNVLPSVEMLAELSESAKNEYIKIHEAFVDAKEYGSLLRISECDFKSLNDELKNISNIFIMDANTKVIPLLKQWKILSEKYDVVVTNPPYMGSRGMTPLLSKYVKKYFYNSKADMFSVFIEQVRYFCKEKGIYGMITQPSFLFLKSFEELRYKLLTEQTILSLLHMGRGIFGIDFGSAAFVISNSIVEDYSGDYYRLHKRTFQYIELEDIRKIFLNAIDDKDFTFIFEDYQTAVVDEVEESEKTNREPMKIYHRVKQKDLLRMPGSPIAYWVSDNMLKVFIKSEKMEKYGTPRTGIMTGNNDRFLRFWWEVGVENANFNATDSESAINSNKKWFPYNKGGDFRKWYGNNEYVLNWENGGNEVFKMSKSEKRNSQDYPNEYKFKRAISWSLITSTSPAFRIKENNLSDIAGPSFFTNEEHFHYLLGLCNSAVGTTILNLLNPTINIQGGNIAQLPVIFDKESEVNELVKKNIELSKADWDSFETSWDFENHPLIKWTTFIKSQHKEEKSSIAVSYSSFLVNVTRLFQVLKDNEEELNSIFVDTYKLNNEITVNIRNDEITITNPNDRDLKSKTIKSLISYAVGCMFGRYSLDEDGLIYAGGNFDESKYKTFKVDKDNVIPITENSYFSDDIVSRFKNFIEVVWGKDTLNENLNFIAEALGKRGTETSEDTIRRYFNNDFYNDHVKMYQKKPIYWLFESGNKNGFKCLVYMHRYNDGLVAKVRLDYLHKMQTTYERLLTDINSKLSNEDLDMSSKKEAQKQQVDINAKLQETIEYDEKIAHIANQRINIDLDDGVTVNYSKFVYKNTKTGKEESILGKLR